MGSVCSTCHGASDDINDFSTETVGMFQAYRSENISSKVDLRDSPPANANNHHCAPQDPNAGVSRCASHTDSRPEADVSASADEAFVPCEAFAPCERLAIVPSDCEWSHSELPRTLGADDDEASRIAEPTVRMFAAVPLVPETMNPFTASTMSTVSTAVDSVHDPCMFHHSGDSWKTIEGCPLNPALVANVLMHAATF